MADVVTADPVAGTEPGAVPESMKDVTRLHTWGRTPLGTHGNRPMNPLVLLIRGDLLKKYPNTIVYAVPATRGSDGVRRPDLEGYIPDNVTPQPGPDSAPRFPVLTGSLPPDVTFFGFVLAKDQVRSSDRSEGWYFVLEQRVSEPRFGLDEGQPSAEIGSEAAELLSWRDLTWTHLNGVPPGALIDATEPNVRPAPEQTLTPQWTTSSAAIGSILMQDPVRVAVHADKMLPPDNS